MRTSLLAIFTSAIFTVAPADADYAMLPIGEVLKTVPLIVDATVTRIDAKTGNTHLHIHRTLRGAIDSKSPVITGVALTCTPGMGPGKYGILAKKRYILLLESEDTLFEESTYFEITGDPKNPESLRIRYSQPGGKSEAPEVTFQEFAKLIAPVEAASIKR